MIALIPTVERANGYPDLDVLLTSLVNYAPDLPWVVGYYGDRPGFAYDYCPDDYVFLKRPEAARRCGAGFGWLLDQTAGNDDDVALLLNDDLVFTPSTLERLEEDLAALPDTWGACSLRSNYIAGRANIRRCEEDDGYTSGLGYDSERRVLRVSKVFLVALAVKRSALAAITRDWTQLDWYGDNLLSFDLTQAGYSLHVSRAYVHHHGSRTTTRAQFVAAEAEGRQWLIAHRPRTWAAMGGAE